MLALYCPFCQSTRDESEFACLGEAFIERPQNPDQISDSAWADYLFMRTNTKGRHWEQWQHRAGCRKIFAVRRDTVSYQIADSLPLSEARASLASSDTERS